MPLHEKTQMKSKETPKANHPEKPGNDIGRAISRRSFVAGGMATIGTLAGFAPLIIPRSVLGGEGYQAPSNTLAIAAVGVGGMGRNYLAGCIGERIVALCDLDHTRANTIDVFKKYPNATRYHDFREMFDKESKNFDALIIGTPDHTHTIILLPALQLGKHIYCAKPITHSIGEARKVRQAVVAAKQLVTKSSVQSSGTEGARSTTELLTSGVIGPVHELHIW
ncbi:MAG TPA: Gfo/Idh/MocA family oxidoreductase, partial [Thermoguttaceae bacterium]